MKSFVMILQQFSVSQYQANEASSPYLSKSCREFLKDVPFRPSSSCSAMKITTLLLLFTAPLLLTYNHNPDRSVYL